MASSPAVVPQPAHPRPLRSDARRNYDALLAAARTAFAADGSLASLEDIARHAEVGIGTLYRHFPTRSALIEAVYVDEIASLVEVAEQSLALEPADAFTTWVHRFVDYVGTKRVLIDGINKDTDLFRSCRDAMYGSGGPVLERAQRAGAVRSDTDIYDVLHLIAGITGVAYSDDAQRERVLALALDGLRPR
ncbi:MAG TPA: TetR/AcrR family transcriptional regulator [Pseudolysinimonas sp.]|nr:TetR/AcrR family transcriptional regulator [Pseudolysinimonas sp.]